MRAGNVFPRVTDRDLPFAARAFGASIWDSSGKHYLDGSGGAIVVGVGHGDEQVIEAMTRQASSIAYSHGTQFTTEALERYASRVAPLLPLEEARVYPVSGGSEAVETALKIARTYHVATGRSSKHKVIARLGSYHGNTRGALDASGRASLRRPYSAWLGAAVHVPAVYEYRCPWDTHDSGCGVRHAELLDRVIREQGPETVACFIAEPVVGAALGAVAPPSDLWAAVQEVCRTHGVLLIADEVMTGFGRTGRWFGSDHWGLQPDILTAGKGVTSGYWPFGFAAVSSAIFDAIAPTGFVHGFTYSHSAVGAAVAEAVLARLHEGELVEASRRKGERLLALLRDALGDHPCVGDIRGLGLMVGVELVAERSSKRPFRRAEKITEQVVGAAKAQGLLVYPSTGGAAAGEGDVIMLGPPFVITDDEIAELVESLGRALGSVPGLQNPSWE
ncbi:MAG: aminotransferase class III-fold pyridoxal phosphate-dependent enzyme [Actinomycetota bacterium]|nr:aminotransferase class III-fold pyridoxal phosphate-dependent enzyme [Actinomycetota bacterium]